MDSLETRIQYRFRDPALLDEAMTHPSRRYELRGKVKDNQRLEFLGDAILDMVLSSELFTRMPDVDEGMMTKLRTRLVSETALAGMARRIGLGEFVQLGRSVEISGGRDRNTTLADALEALVGAIYVDSSLENAQRFVLFASDADLREVLSSPVEVNPKGELQELLQSLANVSPAYETVLEEGPSHDRRYHVTVAWQGRTLGKGEGTSKKDAEIASARNALESAELKQLLRDIQATAPKQPAEL